MTRVILLVSVLLLAGCFDKASSGGDSSGTTSTPGTPLKMLALGDSITRATDAIQGELEQATWVSLMNRIAGAGSPLTPDEITQLKLNLLRDNTKSLSWSAGNAFAIADGTHFNLLTAAGAAVTVDNEAVNGAEATGLAAQVTAAQSGKAWPPDYVTLLIGGNDICNAGDYNGPNYIAAIKGVLDTIIAANSHVKILVSEVPKITDLRVHGTDTIPGTAVTCADLWNFLKAQSSDSKSPCDTIFFGDTGVFTTAVNNLADANSRIETLDSDPTYSTNVKVARTIATEDIEADQISPVDCFHPSVKGQEHLGAETWKDGWYTHGL